MATIEDVAREAGVGVGTVSRVLSGHPRVAPKTRARVQAAIERLGYQPSRAAQALARGRSHTIEVIAPLLTRYYYFEILRGVLAALAETNYLLNIRVLERPADVVEPHRCLTDLYRGTNQWAVAGVQDADFSEGELRIHGVAEELVFVGRLPVGVACFDPGAFQFEFEPRPELLEEKHIWIFLEDFGRDP